MKKIIGLAMAVVMVLSMASFAAADAPPVFEKTDRFDVMETDEGLSMLSRDGELIIHVSADADIAFEDDTVTVAEALADGQTLAELLDGRNLTVSYSITTRSIPPQTTPEKIIIHYEIAVALPPGDLTLEGIMPEVDVVLPELVQDMIAGLSEGESWKVDRFTDELLSYDGALMINIGEHTEILTPEGMTFKGETIANRMLVVFYDITTKSEPPQTTPTTIIVLYETPVAPIYEFTPEEIEELFPLNGEVVVNGEIIEAPAPYYINGVVMVPVRAIAEALGYEVNWDEEVESVRLGNAIHLWIGEDRYEVGRMAPIALGTAPELTNERTFVPMSFFSNVISGVSAYTLEGQVCIGPEGDMV